MLAAESTSATMATPAALDGSGTGVFVPLISRAATRQRRRAKGAFSSYASYDTPEAKAQPCTRSAHCAPSRARNYSCPSLLTARCDVDASCYSGCSTPRSAHPADCSSSSSSSNYDGDHSTHSSSTISIRIRREISCQDMPGPVSPTSLDTAPTLVPYPCLVPFCPPVPFHVGGTRPYYQLPYPPFAPCVPPIVCISQPPPPPYPQTRQPTPPKHHEELCEVAAAPIPHTTYPVPCWNLPPVGVLPQPHTEVYCSVAACTATSPVRPRSSSPTSTEAAAPVAGGAARSAPPTVPRQEYRTPKYHGYGSTGRSRSN
jgi:hypothetical protein